MCPVFKKEDKQCASNYHFISSTYLVAKVFERIVHSRLYSMLEQNKILCNNQFGLYRRRSTSSLLLTAVEDWTRALNSHHSVHCLF